MNNKERKELLQNYFKNVSLDKEGNANKITQKINKDQMEKISYTAIVTYILQNYNKVWDKKQHKWIDKSEDNKGAPDAKNKDTSNNNNKENGSDTQSGTKTFEDLILASDINNLNDVNKAVYNYTSTVNKNVKYVKSELNEIKNKSLPNLNSKIDEIKKWLEDNLELLTNEYIIYSENISTFIQIYACDKNRKSVYINQEILNKLNKKMKDEYNIINNDSKAIDTAMLIALFSSKKKDI